MEQPQSIDHHSSHPYEIFQVLLFRTQEGRIVAVEGVPRIMWKVDERTSGILRSCPPTNLTLMVSAVDHGATPFTTDNPRLARNDNRFPSLPTWGSSQVNNTAYAPSQSYFLDDSATVLHENKHKNSTTTRSR